MFRLDHDYRWLYLPEEDDPRTRLVFHLFNPSDPCESSTLILINATKHGLPVLLVRAWIHDYFVQTRK